MLGQFSRKECLKYLGVFQANGQLPEVIPDALLVHLIHFFESPVYLVHIVPHGMNVIESPHMSFVQHLSWRAHVLTHLLQQ